MKDNKINYEIVVVFAPKTEEKTAEATFAKVEKWLGANETKISKKDHMGQKTLEYPINSFEKGDFWVLSTEGEKRVNVADLNVMLNREVGVIRYLVLKN